MLLGSQFIITVLLEYIILASFERRSLARLFFIVLGVHFITHPLGAWFLVQQQLSYLVIEVVIFLVESIIYWKVLNISVKKAFIYSLTANIVSITIGYLLIVWF